MPRNPHVERLARYRLERDLTFEGLAAEMTAAGFPIGLRSLHHTLTGRGTRPIERTRYKIARFVETHVDVPARPSKKAPKSKRRSRVAA